jgi:hypothetical protein
LLATQINKIDATLRNGFPSSLNYQNQLFGRLFFGSCGGKLNLRRRGRRGGRGEGRGRGGGRKEGEREREGKKTLYCSAGSKITEVAPKSLLPEREK